MGGFQGRTTPHLPLSRTPETQLFLGSVSLSGPWVLHLSNCGTPPVRVLRSISYLDN